MVIILNSLLDLTIRDIGVLYVICALILAFYILIYLAVKSVNWIDKESEIDRELEKEFYQALYYQNLKNKKYEL